MWGDKCSTDKDTCEYYDALDNEEVTGNKIEYELEWQAYVSHWNGNDKWGDLYDA